MILMDGKSLASEIKNKLVEEAKSMEKTPGLAVILVGENPASKKYVQMKERACDEVGISHKVHRLEENVSDSEIEELILKLNKDESIDGIIVQLPLSKHRNTNEILENIDPSKDVDGLTITNVGRLEKNLPGLFPATPLGVMELLKKYKIEIAGKNAVVIGRSNLVGKPLAQLLLNAGATVTIAHSKTKNIGEVTKNADILVSAVGRPGLITADMVKDQAVVIDVGTTEQDEKLKGDIDFPQVSKKASYITPVPGGVGPMTVAMLLSNVVKAAGGVNRFIGRR